MAVGVSDIMADSDLISAFGKIDNPCQRDCGNNK